MENFIMKRFFLNLCFCLVAAFVFLSCNDDVDEYYVSYGVIQNTTSANNYEILTDKGNILKVTESHTIYKIEDGKRILANYNILSENNSGNKEYVVKVNGFYNLLSKPVVEESFIKEKEEARLDSIGNDPFVEIHPWFGGDYINIDFLIYYQEFSNTKHMINLIYDDIHSTRDTLYVKLRHNAYKELPSNGYSYFKGYGRSSFKLADLLPEGVNSLTVKLTWNEYENYSHNVKECSDTGVFTKGGNNSERTISKTGFDTSIEVK
jgi:hypothetical protein